MNIALIGYGKMGEAIEKIAEERGHKIALICNSELSVNVADFSNVDIAIEFTEPSLAVGHIDFCLEKQIPIVVGTTGWKDSLDEVTEKVKDLNGSLLHASNFSIGVNIFCEINKKLAQLMSTGNEYKVSVEETHHLQKLDCPSGTGISISNDILSNNSNYISWVLGKEELPYTNRNQFPLVSYRKPDVPGFHKITYSSEIDTIEISHEAHNRKGFALGAVIAAEFLLTKKGIYGMNDVLKF
jgi:4-hydroxy-tetrahydrodipicolinate reductase